MENEERLKMDFLKLLGDFQIMYCLLQKACEDDDDDNENLSRESLNEKGSELYRSWMPLFLKMAQNFLKECEEKEASDGK